MQRNLTPCKAESRFYSRLTCAPSPNISPTVRSMKTPPQGTGTCIELFVSTEVSTSLSQSWAEQHGTSTTPASCTQSERPIISFICRQVNGEVIREENMWLWRQPLRLSPSADAAITLMCRTSVAHLTTVNPPTPPPEMIIIVISKIRWFLSPRLVELTITHCPKQRDRL